MTDQIHDKWRSGQATPLYNDIADSRSPSERLNNINSRGERLPEEDQGLYRHMVETQERDYNKLLAGQESSHRQELERLTSDFLKDKEGFNMQETSPKARREFAEKKAGRVMADREDREQSRYLQQFLTQREGFVEYSEVETAKKLAAQDKQKEVSKTEGRKR